MMPLSVELSKVRLQYDSNKAVQKWLNNIPDDRSLADDISTGSEFYDISTGSEFYDIKTAATMDNIGLCSSTHACGGSSRDDLANVWRNVDKTLLFPILGRVNQEIPVAKVMGVPGSNMSVSNKTAWCHIVKKLGRPNDARAISTDANSSNRGTAIYNKPIRPKSGNHVRWDVPSIKHNNIAFDDPNEYAPNLERKSSPTKPDVKIPTITCANASPAPEEKDCLKHLKQQRITKDIRVQKQRRHRTGNPDLLKQPSIVDAYIIEENSDASGDQSEQVLNTACCSQFQTEARDSSFPEDTVSSGTADGRNANLSAGYATRARRSKSAATSTAILSGNKDREHTLAVAVPVIKGLIVDKVTNQKPDLVKASSHANVREEFALKHRVQSYQTTCKYNITKMNQERRKLSAHLQNLKRMMVARSKADQYMRNAQERSRSRRQSSSSEELFYRRPSLPGNTVVETVESTPGTANYSFPPLTYPARKRLALR